MLRKKYGHSAAGTLLWRWAGGAGATEGGEDGHAGKSVEQVRAEEEARTTQTVREGVLWFLRRGLEGAASVQRSMVEKRIERVREKEKSVLYKSAGQKGVPVDSYGSASAGPTAAGPAGSASAPSIPTPDAAVLSEADSAQIESQLSAEQLQLFAEENDSMLRHYEDTLGKVQYVYPLSEASVSNWRIPFLFTGMIGLIIISFLYCRNAEKSLIEISSLQETLVSHLATQEEYISQLVNDVDTTQTNVGQGNRELKRATERRSTAQAVFWGTVGLCTWLVVWDLVF